MPVTVNCKQCGKEKTVIPAVAKTFRFCSVRCRADWRSANWLGDKHPRWTGGDREKICKQCGETFRIREGQPITTFKKQKFCSKPCADKGGLRYSGKDHPNYRDDALRLSRSHGHHKWQVAVLSRDRETCQHCGASGVEMHAHHIKSFKDHPELRYEVSNGITLCYRCHWNVHSAENENGVNSGKLLTGGAEDNPEPSQGGNVLEGVTTRGRAYRRWTGECPQCGGFISKRLSDVKNKLMVFCSKSCSAKWRWRNGRYMPTAVISSTSAPRESEDIV